MIRRLFPLVLLLAVIATAGAQESTTRVTDSSLTQKWTSTFGYSVSLPEKARFNKLASETKATEGTERVNFLLSGQAGTITLRYYTEKRMVPKPYKLIDSIHYFEVDSVGTNGKIRRRILILTDASVQIEVLLTPKGEKEYADKVTAIFDSFVPPPTASRTLEAWRYGRNAKDFEQGRYPAGGGPNKGDR